MNINKPQNTDSPTHSLGVQVGNDPLRKRVFQMSEESTWERGILSRNGSTRETKVAVYHIFIGDKTIIYMYILN